MTGKIKETSSETLCQELSLESIRSGGWLRKLCLISKVYKNE